MPDRAIQGTIVLTAHSMGDAKDTPPQMSRQIASRLPCLTGKERGLNRAHPDVHE